MNGLTYKTYNELFDYITKSYTNKSFLNYLDNGEYKSISINDFKEKVICLALALQEIGIKKGDTVAIFAKSSPFWLIFDFAIQKIGAISVPIFDNISKINLNFEIEDANINYMFCDNETRIADIEKEIVFITHKFCRDEKNFHNVDEIFTSTQATCNINDLRSENFPDVDDVFSIIYTSGNTGTPKGVQLTHKNIINQLYDVSTLIDLKEKEDVILTLLPLAHIFERMVMSFYLSRGVSIYFVDEIPNVANLLKVVRPTIMTVVPRLLEKIFNKIKLNISEKPFIARTIASLAFEYAMKENIDKNSLAFKIYDKVVYSKLREIFGGRTHTVVTGGAALNRSIYQFFINIGVNLYQGYGLTETSPVISTNYPGNLKVGSCGKPMPSIEVKISDKKEVLTKSDSLMKGYLNNPELTNKTIDSDGWLHTGDIGYIDEDGYLFVESRIKDIFKTSTGNYVNALKIEQELSKNKYIEFAVIIANNKQYVSALLFIDKERYLARKEKDILSIDEFFHQDEIIADIEKQIRIVNNSLNEWEKVIEYKIMTNDISIEGGELTPSMKICRGKIEEKYEEIINQMY